MNKGLIPVDLVPFARDSGDDYCCVDRRDGGVVAYSTDHSDDPKRATTRVADSIAEFLDGMQTEL